MVEAAQERPDPRRPGAAVVDRRDREQHQRGRDEHRRADPGRRGRATGRSARCPAASVSGAGAEVQPAAQLGLDVSSLGGLARTDVDARTYGVGAGLLTCATVPVRLSRCECAERIAMVVAIGRGGLEARLRTGPLPRATRPGCCAGCPTDQLPKHVGVMLDGNRRWARAVGRDTAHGHRAGAANIEPLLELVRRGRRSRSSPCGCSRPTTSTGPRPSSSRCWRSSRTPSRRSPTQRRWRLHPVGALDLLPAADRRRAQGRRGGHPRRRRDAGQRRRRRTAAAARSPTPSARCSSEHAGRGTSLEELAEIIDVEHIAEHLYTKGQPDPDLVIRTSGEQRLGGFLLWQSAQVGVLLLRGLLAGLPPGRLPARDPRLRPARAPLRRLSRPRRSSLVGRHARSPRVRACRTERPPRRRTFATSASGEARRIGRPKFVSTIHDRRSGSSRWPARGGRHSGPRAPSRSDRVN